MKSPKTDLLQGTLDSLILRTLASGDMHGWGISQRLQQVSRDVLQVTQGSLYPALYRLEQRSEEHTSELQSLAYLVCRLLLEKKKIALVLMRCVKIIAAAHANTATSLN